MRSFPRDISRGLVARFFVLEKTAGDSPFSLLRTAGGTLTRRRNRKVSRHVSAAAWRTRPTEFSVSPTSGPVAKCVFIDVEKVVLTKRKKEPVFKKRNVSKPAGPVRTDDCS